MQDLGHKDLSTHSCATQQLWLAFFLLELIAAFPRINHCPMSAISLYTPASLLSQLLFDFSPLAPVLPSALCSHYFGLVTCVIFYSPQRTLFLFPMCRKHAHCFGQGNTVKLNRSAGISEATHLSSGVQCCVVGNVFVKWPDGASLYTPGFSSLHFLVLLGNFWIC